MAKRRVGFVTHPDCALHDCEGHPEHAGRTKAIERYFKETGLADLLIPVTPREANISELELNHEPGYIAWVKQLSPTGLQHLDNDTYVNPHSWRAALLAYGGVITAVEELTEGELDRAFCCLRPPGHHAEYDRGMGFCVFNNIAGGAHYARKSCGIDRVAIIDFDVHHGNGTQRSFYADKTVHFTSVHQWPFYPGTGFASDEGVGAGEGFTINIPLCAGTRGVAAIGLLEMEFREAMAAFQPQLIMVSAGFDAHIDDPLASLCFEDEDYYVITKIICEVADKYAAGRVVSVLEGGYNLAALSRSAAQHVKGLLEND